MICFRDMTFCPFHEECTDGTECPRALTEQVESLAVEWWGSNSAPIAQFSERPHCFSKVAA